MKQPFRIVAYPDPQTLPRIMGVFAQRSLIPVTLAAQLRDGMLHVEVGFDDLDPATAAIVTAKLCEAVLVASARCDAPENADEGREEVTPTTVAAA
ncbi:MAG: hypothetical protein JNN10_17560 [Sphingopyxis sp.]|uniref:hypothetical protein n=1 Tax=Sphingopyxis sp. TaxID=1908224 RepID=UPI001A48893F|nr:hypothetical protein [Sphingopyxis sp.]MBL9068093.1 hypothetical protein [Sphingopyxis sp.]